MLRYVGGVPHRYPPPGAGMDPDASSPSGTTGSAPSRSPATLARRMKVNAPLPSGAGSSALRNSLAVFAAAHSGFGPTHQRVLGRPSE